MRLNGEDGEKRRYTVFLRPGVIEFLERAAQRFELIIFTAATQKYADPIIDALEGQMGFFSKRLYRQHCSKKAVPHVGEVYVKEM